MAAAQTLTTLIDLSADVFLCLGEFLFSSVDPERPFRVVNYPLDFVMDRTDGVVIGSLVHRGARRRDGRFEAARKKSRGVPQLALCTALPQNLYQKGLIDQQAWSQVLLHFPRLGYAHHKAIIDYLEPIMTKTPGIKNVRHIHIFESSHLAVFIADEPTIWSRGKYTQLDLNQMGTLIQSAFANIRTLQLRTGRHRGGFESFPGNQGRLQSIYAHVDGDVYLQRSTRQGLLWPGLVRFGRLLRSRLPRFQYLVLSGGVEVSWDPLDWLAILELDDQGNWSLVLYTTAKLQIAQAVQQYPHIQLKW